MTLFEAVAANDVGALTKALQAARDVNVLGEEKRTPLHAAAKAGSAAMVKALLEAGAEPSLKDASDETALLLAAANGHREVVALLAPHATDDERDLARAFLAASGRTDGPASDVAPSKLEETAATAAARAAKFFGHDDPQDRLDRNDRAKKKGR
jgi:serine/threonine-protein phosphatase 6 regulatory ankyrin repeat subunit C